MPTVGCLSAGILLAEAHNLGRLFGWPPKSVVAIEALNQFSSQLVCSISLSVDVSHKKETSG